MKITIEDVTPAISRNWLKHNGVNRVIRPSHVESLRAAFERGEYVMSHQGIAFDEQGHMIDGQHRVSAIAGMPDTFSVKMVVARNVPREAFMVMDTGLKRTASDILARDRREVEVGRLICSLYFGKGHASSISAKFLEPVCEMIAPIHRDLLAYCASTSKTLSSTPVRTAAVLTILAGGDADYTKLIYKALVTADFHTLPPAAQALYSAFARGQITASKAYDLLLRCLKVFDPRKSTLSKIQINDVSAGIAEVRAMVAVEIMRDEPEEPPEPKPAPTRKSNAPAPAYWLAQ